MMQIQIATSEVSDETRDALRFLRENDPTGAFIFVARTILEAQGAGAGMGHDHVEFMICNLAHVLSVARPGGSDDTTNG